MCDLHTILNRITVKDGKFTLPDGVSYSLLVFRESTLMTPQVLNKISEFLQGGGMIMVQKPKASPSLSNQPSADNFITSFSNKLWAKYNQQIFWGPTVAQVVKKMGMTPDIQTSPSSPLNYLHKTIGADDYYFVVNPLSKSIAVDVSFRTDEGVVQQIVCKLGFV